MILLIYSIETLRLSTNYNEFVVGFKILYLKGRNIKFQVSIQAKIYQNTKKQFNGINGDD